MPTSIPFDFAVAVIGGDPAGLSAALTLGRACRSVVLFATDKQCTSVAGVYLAGDADGDVQFSIVAAAEGAVAATAIHQALLDQEQAD